MFSGYELSLFLPIFFLRKEFIPIQWHFAYSSVAYPDLQKRGGGGGLKKNCFQLFGPQFGLKIRGGGEAGPTGPSPGSTTVLATV